MAKTGAFEMAVDIHAMRCCGMCGAAWSMR